MEITLNGGDTINVITNDIFDDPGCIARDDSGRDISESVKIKGIADTTQPGTYTISYSVTDPAGNTVKTVIHTITARYTGQFRISWIT